MEEARQSVADVLLQRARERRIQSGTAQRSRANPDAPAKNTDFAQNSARTR
jgi:hypothetical protein